MAVMINACSDTLCYDVHRYEHATYMYMYVEDLDSPFNIQIYVNEFADLIQVENINTYYIAIIELNSLEYCLHIYINVLCKIIKILIR